MCFVSFDIQENFEGDYSDRINHPIVEVNIWLESHCGSVMHPLTDQMMNGYVNPTNIWIGYFSRLDTDKLLDIIQSQDWRIKDSVEIAFKGQEDDRLSLFHLT